MSNSNGKISAPVNTYDAARVTRKGSNDVGTLCGDNALVNMWAKYKPVRNTLLDYTGDSNQYDAANKVWKSTATWWKASGSRGNCGIFPQSVNALANLPSLIDGNLNGWVYDQPRGSSVTPNEPYRLTDFLQYNHNATPPITGFRGDSRVRNKNGDVWQGFVNLRGDETDMVNLSDLPTLWNSYFGIYAVCQNTGSTATRSYISPYKISVDGGGGASIDNCSTTGWPAGEWKIYPFVANSSSNPSSYYTLPLTSVLDLEVVNEWLVINILATVTGEMERYSSFGNCYKVLVNVTITNNYLSQGVTISSNPAPAWNTIYNDGDQSTTTGEITNQPATFTTMTIPAGETVVNTFTAYVTPSVLNYENGGLFRTTFTANGENYSKEEDLALPE